MRPDTCFGSVEIWRENHKNNNIIMNYGYLHISVQ